MNTKVEMNKRTWKMIGIFSFFGGIVSFYVTDVDETLGFVGICACGFLLTISVFNFIKKGKHDIGDRRHQILQGILGFISTDIDPQTQLSLRTNLYQPSRKNTAALKERRKKPVPVKIPNPNDVQIGENEWIPFTEYIRGVGEEADLDPMLEPVMSFMSGLEICAPACCGLKAFGFHRDHIHQVSVDFNKAELLASFEVLIEEMEQSPVSGYYSERMNFFLLDKTMLLKIFQHIADSLRSSPST